MIPQTTEQKTEVLTLLQKLLLEIRVAAAELRSTNFHGDAYEITVELIKSIANEVSMHAGKPKRKRAARKSTRDDIDNPANSN